MSTPEEKAGNLVLPYINRLAIEHEVDQDIVRAIMGLASLTLGNVREGDREGRPIKVRIALSVYASTFKVLAKHLNISLPKMENLLEECLVAVAETLSNPEYQEQAAAFAKAKRDSRRET